MSSEPPFDATQLHLPSKPGGTVVQDKRLVPLTCSILALLAAAPAAWADEADAVDLEETKFLEEMVVTATRTERQRFTTPVATDILTKEDIRLLQPLSFQELFEQTPGVEIQGGARRIAEEPSIRGFSDTQIILRVDGGRRNFDLAHRGRFFLDPDMVKRIEVARGGASSLFGSGGLGGAIELETVDASDLLLEGESVGARLKGGYQTNGDEPFVGAALFGDAGPIDAVGQFVYRQTFEDLNDGDDTPILDTQDRLFNGLGKIGIDPAPGHRAEAIVNVFQSDGENPTAADSVSSPDTVVDRETTVVDVRGIYDVVQDNGLVDARAVFYYTDLDLSEDRFFDGRVDESQFRTIGGDLRNTFHLVETDTVKTLLTVGFEGFVDTQSGTRDGADRLQFPDAERRFWAGYAAAEIDLFGGRINLLPSVRFDRVRLESDAAMFEDRTDSEPSGRIAVGFRPVQPLYFWGSWSRAFRSPSLTELFTDGIHFTVPLGPDPMSGVDQIVVNEFVPAPGLEPEIARTAEGGVRLDLDGVLFSDDALNVSVGGYRTRVENFVEQQVIFISGAPSFTPPFGPLVFPGVTLSENVDATLFGFEGQARYAAGPLYATLSGHFLGSENDETGTGLASIPLNRINLIVEGRSDRFSLRGGVKLTVTFDRTDVAEGTLLGEGYETVDLFAAWSPQAGPLAGTTLRVGIDNVANETFSIFPTAINQPGRSVRVGLTYRFGA